MKFGFKAVTAVILSIMILCGCSFRINRSSKRDQNWDPTSYSIEDIKSFASKVNALDNIKDDDCTDEALNAYNIMLGYAENAADFEYKVYDFYHVDFPTVKSYVVKLISSSDNEEIKDDEKLITSDYRIVMLTCNEDGTDVQSEIEPKLMARRWIEELSAAVTAEYPDYHINGQYISLDHIVPHVFKESYSDRSDYTYFFKNDFYESGDYKYYDNVINVIVPPDTPEESAQKIYSELEYILRKYCVTSVNIYAPTDSEVYNRLLDEENLTSNRYNFNDNDIKWKKIYKIEVMICDL